MASFDIIQRNGTVHTVLVDDDDFEEVMKYTWSVAKTKQAYYVRRTVHIATVEGKQKNRTVHLHRQLLGLTDRKILADHINHNTLDNQRANLRIVTHQQNIFNKEKQKLNYLGKKVTSKYKGVFWAKASSKWIAQIKYNGKSKHLGTFNVEEDARDAYEKASKILFKEHRYKEILVCVQN